LREIALRTRDHRRVLVRGDGSTAPRRNFDTDTGEFLRQTTHQAIAEIPAVARTGLGTVRVHHLLRVQPRSTFSRHRTIVRRLLHLAFAGGRSSAVGFQRAGRDRTLLDTSSAAIAAAGLLRLCRLEPDSLKGHFYWMDRRADSSIAVRKASGEIGPKWEGILKGGVYHVHKGLGVDESVMWVSFSFVRRWNGCCGRGRHGGETRETAP